MSHLHIVAEIAAATEVARAVQAYEDLARAHMIEVAQLRECAATRKVIGQAMGLLMGEFGLDEDAAFEVLRRRSSHTNVKLRDIAATMVEVANGRGVGLRPVADC